MKMNSVLVSTVIRAALVATCVSTVGFVALNASEAKAAMTTQIPSGFDVQAWNNWLNTVVQTGTPTEMPNGIYLSKARIEPADTTQSHQADYFSTVGGYAPDGSFVVDHVEGVSETWTVTDDGNRDIDQWLFLVTRDGDLTRTLHMHLVETADGQVLQDDVVASTDDEAMAKWIQQLDSWYAVTTGSTAPAVTGSNLIPPSPVAASNAVDAGATGSHAGIMFQLIKN